MDLIEGILTRRSIRKYKADKISHETLREIIKAGMHAPSAGNEQPWHFIILEDRRALEQISEDRPYAHMVKGAPAAIVVCCDEKLVKHTALWSQDCAAATENILLVAHAKGLGAVWVGIYPREERIEALRKIISLPNHVIPFSLIPLGVPDEKKKAEDRYDPSRIHTGGW